MLGACAVLECLDITFFKLSMVRSGQLREFSSIVVLLRRKWPTTLGYPYIFKLSVETVNKHIKVARLRDKFRRKIKSGSQI